MFRIRIMALNKLFNQIWFYLIYMFLNYKYISIKFVLLTLVYNVCLLQLSDRNTHISVTELCVVEGSHMFLAF